MGLTEPDPSDEALRALEEPRRRAILRLVASTEMSAGEIASAFEVSRTAISQHLSVLKNAGQPPHRFTMTWTGTPAPTEVELVFTALSPALTRVGMEHRGWEALSDAQLSGDCALPGGYASGAYSTGWATILRHFAMATGADTVPDGNH